MSALARVVAASLLATACGDRSPIWIGYPEVEGASTLLLALSDGERARRIVVDLTTTEAFHFDLEGVLDGSGPVALELAALTETTEVLGVTPGELRAPATATCDLPSAPLATYESVISEGVAHVWVPREGYGPLFEGTRLPDPTGACQCRHFTLEVDVIPDPELARFAVPTKDGRVLVVMAGGTLRLFSESTGARSSTVARAPRLEGVVFTAGTVDREGEIWLGAADGGLWRASLSETLDATEVARLPRGSSIDALAIVDPAALEVFVMGEAGKLDHLREGTWTERHDFGAGGFHALLSVDPDRRVLAALSGPVRSILFDGAKETELPSPAFRGSARSTIFVRKLGFVLGGNDGELVRLEDERWVRIVDEGDLRGVYTMLAYEEGFMYGGDFGFLGQIRTRGGRCEIDVRGAEPLGTLHWLGRDLLSVPVRRDLEMVDTKVSRFRSELP